MDKKLYDILVGQLKKYPEMEPCDGVKLLYQGEFGGGHKVKSEYDCMIRIEKDAGLLSPEQLDLPFFEEIGGGYCRMNLSVLQVIPVEVLGKMFIRSAPDPQQGSPAGFAERVQLLRLLCREGRTSFSPEALEAFLASYDMDHPQPVSHSDGYVRHYKPAYRVVKKEYCRFLEAFVRVSRLYAGGSEIAVAIDGQRASGKTTLASLLASVFDCNIFRTEDFASGPDGQPDLARFESEICKKLKTGLPFSYGIYDPVKGKVASRRAVPPKRLSVIEGPCAAHPSLRSYWDLTVFMEVNPILQLERILRQEGREGLRKARDRMIPAENAYIEQCQPKEKCDILYHIL
jgi:uridine kinase